MATVRGVSFHLTGRNLLGVYDGAIQYKGPMYQIGVPAVAGGPYVEDEEDYGPRALIVTLDFHTK